MKYITLVAVVLGLTVSATAKTKSKLKIKKKAPTKTSISKEAHKWLTYDIDIENTTLTNRADSANDMTIYGELLLNVPGSIQSNLGPITTQVGISPELAGSGNADFETDALFNKYGLMYNTLALKGTSPISAIMFLTFADLQKIDGAGSESAFYVILPTKKFELFGAKTTFSSAPNIKLHADADVAARLAANSNVAYQATDKISIALRNEFRFQDNETTRNRLGPQLSVGINSAISVNAYTFTNLDSGEDSRFGVNFGISGTL